MDNNEARKWALEAGATVLEYEQPPKVCNALCALWLRKQAKNETIFDAKRLYRPDALDPRSRWEATAKFATKVDALRSEITNRPMGKVEEKYITGGQRGVQKVAPKASNPDIQLVKRAKLAIKESGLGVRKCFDYAMHHKLLGDIGYYFRAGNSHAVAFDGSKDEFPAIFFDPMVGQFSFRTRDGFAAWWQRCWDDRSNPDTDEVSAWGHIDDRTSLEVDFYRRA